jgi:hypothetical protein
VYLSHRAFPEKWPWSDKPTTSTHQKAARLWLSLLRNRYILLPRRKKTNPKHETLYMENYIFFSPLSRVTSWVQLGIT